MNKKILIVVESSYLLKNTLKNIKIDFKDIHNIEFLATNGSLNKYKTERGKLRYKSINNNIIDKIKYYKGTIIIATDNDDNGELISLEIYSINKNSLRLNENIDSILSSKKSINVEYILSKTNKSINFDTSINFLAKKIQEEINNKKFYEKTGLNLSIDDRILIKALKSNITILSKLPKWIKQNKTKDLYLYLASALNLNKDVNKVYEDSLKEYEEGNISYLRTDMKSHLPITLNNKNKYLSEILNNEIEIDYEKLSSKEFNFLSENIFLIAKILNVGSPSTIMFIYKKANEYKNNSFEDNIDIYQRIQDNELIKFDINKKEINIDKVVDKINSILNKTDKNTENIKKEILNNLSF